MDQDNYINMALSQDCSDELGRLSAAIEPSLDGSEQYRLQMAAISTAAIGYWTEVESIHPDYDTVALRDVAKLYEKYATLQIAIRNAMNELGVPQPGCPAPVASAYDHLHRAYYAGIEYILNDDDYKPAPLPTDGLVE